MKLRFFPESGPASYCPGTPIEVMWNDLVANSGTQQYENYIA